MQQSTRGLVYMLICAGLFMTACQQQAEQMPEQSAEQLPQRESAFTGQYAGSALYRVRLTPKAAEKYNLKTAPVGQEQVSGSLRRVVPEAAIIRDQRGGTWIYTNPDTLLYIRTAVTVDQVDAGRAVLSDGPTAGTSVVISGADQLLNNERDESVAESGAAGSNKAAMTGQSIPDATATMLENGSIKVVHRATGATGFTANIVIEYKPGDEDYQKILDLVGGLKPGETKSMPAVPEL